MFETDKTVCSYAILYKSIYTYTKEKRTRNRREREWRGQLTVTPIHIRLAETKTLYINQNMN